MCLVESLFHLSALVSIALQRISDDPELLDIQPAEEGYGWFGLTIPWGLKPTNACTLVKDHFEEKMKGDGFYDVPPEVLNSNIYTM